MTATSDNELIKLENKCVVGKNFFRVGQDFFKRAVSAIHGSTEHLQLWASAEAQRCIAAPLFRPTRRFPVFRPNENGSFQGGP